MQLTIVETVSNRYDSSNTLESAFVVQFFTEYGTTWLEVLFIPHEKLPTV